MLVGNNIKPASRQARSPGKDFMAENTRIQQELPPHDLLARAITLNGTQSISLLRVLLTIQNIAVKNQEEYTETPSSWKQAWVKGLFEEGDYTPGDLQVEQLMDRMARQLGQKTLGTKETWAIRNTVTALAEAELIQRKGDKIAVTEKTAERLKALETRIKIDV